MTHRALLAGLLLVAGVRAADAQGAVASATQGVKVASAGRVAPATLRAARDLPRGLVLSLGDIVAEADGNPASIDGWITRRIVRQGEALREPAIAPPQLVHAGAPVRVQATVDGIVVSRDGTALGPGVLGERVRVRLDAQRTITGPVTGPATISLP